jgi:hypothetical protein
VDNQELEHATVTNVNLNHALVVHQKVEAMDITVHTNVQTNVVDQTHVLVTAHPHAL